MTWREERARITDALIISIDADIETILKKIVYMQKEIIEKRKTDNRNSKDFHPRHPDDK